MTPTTGSLQGRLVIACLAFATVTVIAALLALGDVIVAHIRRRKAWAAELDATRTDFDNFSHGVMRGDDARAYLREDNPFTRRATTGQDVVINGRTLHLTTDRRLDADDLAVLHRLVGAAERSESGVQS